MTRASCAGWGCEAPPAGRPAVRTGPRWDHLQVSLYRDEGIVLRTQPLGEADRIVTVLTRRTGRVRAVAKGVRRTRSRFGARLEPFSHAELQLYASPRPAPALGIVTEAVTVDAFGGALAADFARWASATTLAEAAERLTPEEAQPALRLYLLLLGALRALAGGERPPDLVADAFLLRALAASGYGLALDRCASCSAPGPHSAVSVAAGGVVCPSCQPAASVRPAPATLGLLAGLAGGDWAAVAQAPATARREAAGVVAAFWNWHSERALRSWPMVERG